MKKTHIIVSIVFCSLAVVALPLTLWLSQHRQELRQHAQSMTTDFITRSGSTLFFHGSPFRFAGANMHWLGIDDAGGRDAAGNIFSPSHARIDNGFNAAQQMGVTVVRAETLGVSVGCPNCIEPTLNQFNDQAFESIDYAIKTAAVHNIHLIIPLTDQYHYYMGGKHTFTDWRFISDENQFYTDPTVLQDFKTYVAHILNHINHYTGIALKDDPTIMAWETGNEIYPPSSWTQLMAEYLKSLAPQQLVVDGRLGIDPASLSISSVDLYSDHFYPRDVQRLTSDLNMVSQTNKVFFVGEYDWTNMGIYPWESAPHSSSSINDFLHAIETSHVAGDLFWELYDTGYNLPTFCLHYPADAFDSAMQTADQLLIAHASRMNTVIPTSAVSLTSAPTQSPSTRPTPLLTLTTTPTRSPLSTTPPVFDTASSPNITGMFGGHTLSWVHTTTTNSNRLLVVGVGVIGGTVGSVSYAGQQLTQIGSATYCDGYACNVSQWYLKNPPPGANTITVTLSGATSVTFSGGAVTYANVDQTTPIGTNSSAHGTNSSPSVSLPSTPSEVIVDSVVAHENGSSYTLSVGGSQTQRWNVNDGNNLVGGSTRAGQASSTTMSWTTSSSLPWAQIAVPINAAAATLTPTLTPTSTPIPTATPLPTVLSQPTATPTPSSAATQLGFTLFLDGIGKAGDSQNHNSGGNMNPLHPQRTVTVEVFDRQNTEVASQSGTITFHASSGDFTGTVAVTNVPDGVYTVKVTSPQYLRTLLPGVQTLTAGQINLMPPVYLATGDINGDNVIDLQDYNILIGCYSDLAPAQHCTNENTVLADLNDDGHVDGVDYNLFVRELIRPGQ